MNDYDIRIENGEIDHPLRGDQEPKVHGGRLEMKSIGTKKAPCCASGDDQVRMTRQVLEVCERGRDALVKRRKDGGFKVYELSPKAVDG